MLKDVIKSARLDSGLTQEQVAQQVKVAKQTYLKWENGDTEPKATQIALLSKALNITANEICNGKRNKKYAYDEYVLKLMQSSSPQQLISLVAWEHIEDDEQFLKDLDSYLHTSDADRYAVEIEEQVGKNLPDGRFD